MADSKENYFRDLGVKGLTGVLLLKMNFSYSIRATGSNFWPCSKYLEERIHQLLCKSSMVSRRLEIK